MNKKILFLSLFSVFTFIGCNNKTEESSLITRDSIKYYVYAKDDFKGAMVVGYEDSLPNEITIPNEIDGYTVNAIRHESFVLSNITKITIPESVEYIGYRAFAECLSLKTVSLPNSITKIYQNTFAECNELESITIPDTVTEIDTGAFLGCDKLTSVTFSKNLSSLGEYVFYNCPLLDNVDLSSTQIKSIGAYDFQYCTSLSNIKFNNLYKISRHAFSNCSSLSNIYLPDTLSYIGSSAFKGCTSLNNIFIPKSVLYIGEDTFSKINDNFKIMLEHEEIPTAFNSNFNCNYPYVLGANRETKTSDVFVTDDNTNYAINDYASDTPYATLLNSSKTSLILPDEVTYLETKSANVTHIANYAFLNSSLSDITFNTNLKNIGSYAFAYSTSLKEIDLSSTNITDINSYAFYYDYNIETVKLPTIAADRSIKEGAFYKCRKLNSITGLDYINEINLEGYTFAECYNLGTDETKPFVLTSNFNTITLTDFLEWGTTQKQYIKIAKDAYDEDAEGNIYLTANGGNMIKLEKQSSDDTYRNNLFFSDAIITLEAKE